MTRYDDLIAKLESPGPGTWAYGKMAAEAIRSLQRENEQLREMMDVAFADRGAP